MQTTTINDLDIEAKNLKEAALPFRALTHKQRLKILELIHKNGNMTVSPIYQKLGIEQSLTSQHLAILRQSRIVNTTRSGKHIYYSINYQRLNEMAALTLQLAKMETVPEIKIIKRRPRPKTVNSNSLVERVKKLLADWHKAVPVK
jgi:DNA-binding transcriptional ArsR family regulator